MKTSADGKVLLACAKAMGYTKIYGIDAPGLVYGMLHPGCNEVLIVDGVGDGGQYNPMYDDAQAMQLVKRIGLTVSKDPDGMWHAMGPSTESLTSDTSINRAICLCVAKMQKPKTKTVKPRKKK